jgi:HPt (histidine-containing phosphotransfer) domain-containing protein
MNDRLSSWIASRVPIYLEGRKADLEALRSALEQDNFSRVQDIGHKMKGTGSSYGFDQITAIGGRMELAARAGSAAEIGACISALSDCLSRIESAQPENRGSHGGEE